MIILNSRQMREVDRLTVERYGISYKELMENAGTGAADVISEELEHIDGKRISVICGKGNNGGDGAVIARILHDRGAIVKVYLIGSINQTSGEAKLNFEKVNRISQTPESRLGFTEISDHFDKNLIDDSDVIVDALFGTGLSNSVEGIYKNVIEAINEWSDEDEDEDDGRVVVSIDIPSGLSSDTGEITGPAVEPNMTITFTSPKVGNVMSPACDSNGLLWVVNIGSPYELIAEQGSDIHLLDKLMASNFLNTSLRYTDAHKGEVGHVLVIGGSPGKTGAVALTSEASLRSGCGLVTAATSRSALLLLVNQCRSEIMTEMLDVTSGGGMSHYALTGVFKLAEKCDVIVVGPGLSNTGVDTRRFVYELVKRRSKITIIDADGLNALAPWPVELKGSNELPIIITPHPAEMARLVGGETKDIVTNPIEVARRFSLEHNVIVVLKGHRTTIASPDGRVAINPTGNAGMATAGSGDVLAGIIAGFLAQIKNKTPEIKIADAVAASVYLHGYAGDLAAMKLGMRSLIASDIISHLSDAILEIGGDQECPNIRRIES